MVDYTISSLLIVLSVGNIIPFLAKGDNEFLLMCLLPEVVVSIEFILYHVHSRGCRKNMVSPFKVYICGMWKMVLLGF